MNRPSSLHGTTARVVAIACLALAGCASSGAPPSSPSLNNGGKCATLDWNRCTYLF